MFEKLTIENWRQFSKLDIDFHPRLTVLTGANGSGKTTVLNVLSQCVGWEPQFVSSFDVNEDGVRRYSTNVNVKEKNYDNDAMMQRIIPKGNRVFGSLTTKPNSKLVKLLASEDELQEGTYCIYFSSIFPTNKGVFIQSHRPTFPYRKLETIPTSVATRTEIFNKYIDFSKKFAQDEHRATQSIGAKPISSTLLIKQDLASLAIFGYGSGAVASIPYAKTLFEGYCEMLKKVLPRTLGFKKITVAMPEVIIETETGNFPLDGVSGGISSIIDITWQLYMFAEPDEPFIALIDEPENHLHPELQKSFLGNLLKAFPHVQFIVATHNPFVISSQKDSHVYVLDYKDNKVHSILLDHINRAGNSSAILRDVLGLDTTIPLWAEDILSEAIEKFQSSPLTAESMNQLSEELEREGLQDYVPDAIAGMIEGEQR